MVHLQESSIPVGATMSSVPSILGRGVYTFADAAKLTGLSRTRIREWFVGSGTG